MSSLEHLIANALGLEDVDLDINITEAEAAEELAQSQVEVMESVAELTEDADNLETVEEDVESLESLVAVMKNTLDRHEGLDTVSAEMYSIALDSIVSKYGINGTQLLPSMESFGNSPYQNTVISMEKSEGIIAKLKAAIISLGEKIANAARAFGKKIANMFKAARVFCRRRVESVRKFASKVKTKVQVKVRGFKDKDLAANAKFVSEQVDGYVSRLRDEQSKLMKEILSNGTMDEVALAERIEKLRVDVWNEYMKYQMEEMAKEVTAEEVIKVGEAIAKGDGEKTNEKINKTEAEAVKETNDAMKQVNESDEKAKEKLSLLRKLLNAVSAGFAKVRGWFGSAWNAIIGLFKKSADAVEAEAGGNSSSTNL